MARIPSKIGKYPIEAKIAEGGMGAVYKGMHPTLNRPVILKRLTLKGSEHLTERFRREARMMMNFKNENIVNFYDHFKAGDSYYIVLEYIDGSDLSHLIGKERYLGCDLALFIFRESCKALKYAHKHQVIHRDIKPANIMFNTSGEVKLVDFGVAHEGSEEEAGLTTDGMTVGTPSYMAPEQFQDSRNVDERADIYSMGVMLYQMVTGKKPFAGGYSPELLAAIQKNKYLPPGKVNPDVNGITRKIIKKCMRGKADKRYHQVDQILAVLDRYFRSKDEMAIVEELKARIAGEEVPEKKKPKFNMRRILASASILLGTALVLGAAWWFGLFHEYLFQQNTGRMNIELHVNNSYKEYDQIYTRVEIFKDDDMDIPEVEKAVYFRKGMDNEDFHVFQSLPVYLDTGRYRLKIQIEDLLYWYTVYLAPRAEQKTDPVTEKGRTILLEVTDLPVSQVNVSWDIRDCFSQKDLSGDTRVEIYEKGEWTNFNNRKGELLSGVVHKFRFVKEDYYSKEYALKIFPFQKELNILVALTPRAARISLDNSLENVKMTLNGESRYIQGGAVGEMARLGELTTGENSWELVPGLYLLEFSRGRRSASLEMDLQAGENYELKLDYNDDESDLVITEE